MTYTLNGVINKAHRATFKLTAEVMRSAGIELAIGENKVKIKTDPNFTLKEKPIERDWSAASFFFALALLDQSKTIELFELQNHSKQAEHKLFLDLQKMGAIKSHSSFKRHPF